MQPVEASTILLVDDEPVAREALASLLELEGFEVVTAGDGDEAWDCFGRIRPDVVVTDLFMPGTSGGELVRRVRAGSTCPVIVVSAFAPRHGWIDGVADWLQKPLELSALLAAIGRALAPGESPPTGAALARPSSRRAAG